MQNANVASILVYASLAAVMISGVLVSSLSASAFAQDGHGVCRHSPCGTNAPPTNLCSNKPGTISWPSSGGCVPPFCPAGGNKEVRGARLNSGECDPNFNSGSGGNKNTNSGIVPPCIIIQCTAGGAGSSTTGTGTAGGAGSGADVIAIAAGAAGVIGLPIAAGIGGVLGGLPAGGLAPGVIYGGPGGLAAVAVEETATALPVVAIALGVVAAGYWIGCGGEFC
ncbi:MAG: hypothetical protein WAM14_19835 [Candidatus Nitrosopolaris sp.]